MNAPPIILNDVCSHCGAVSQTKDGKCWLCYESKSTPNPYATTGMPLAKESAVPSTVWDNVSAMLLGICVVLTVLIAIGIAVQDPGLLIPLAIFVGPAYLVTFIRGSTQVGTTGKARAGSLFLTFIVSLAATVLIAIVLAVAASILLFLICIQSFGK
ncbi:MAG: hypothetical protein NTU79_16725 [Planctomycetota bacterium]|nr:hypothetical protein [Planctomycetota bacterium]